MNTQISTKLAALAIALMMNSLLIGGVAYVFSMQVHESAAISLERAAAAHEVVRTGPTPVCAAAILCFQPAAVTLHVWLTAPRRG